MTCEILSFHHKRRLENGVLRADNAVFLDVEINTGATVSQGIQFLGTVFFS